MGSSIPAWRVTVKAPSGGGQANDGGASVDCGNNPSSGDNCAAFGLCPVNHSDVFVSIGNPVDIQKSWRN